MLDKMGSMDKLDNDKSLEFSFEHTPCPGKVLMNIENLGFEYNDNNPLIKELSFSIGREDRIGIIGKNGKGKSTLLNLLSRELAPVEGEITNHNSLAIGHFGQTNIDRLHQGNSIVQEITSANATLSTSRIRAICGAMIFEGELAKKKISILSGGERSRVMLGKILANKSNLLLLDEPTNHLDLESIDILSDKMGRYPGAIILVTHSELILRKVVNKLIIFHRNRVELFEGTYDEFLDKIGWEDELAADNSVETPKKTSSINSKEFKKIQAELTREKNRDLKKLKKKEEGFEADIETSEKLVKELNLKLVEASESQNADQIVFFSREIKEEEDSIESNFLSLEKVSEEILIIELEYEKRLTNIDL